MRSPVWLLSGLLLMVSSVFAQGGTPPFSGTAFLHPDIVTADDPSAFIGLRATGSGARNVFDRRINSFTTIQARLFEARYADGRPIEVQVNPEFPADEAYVVATFYARAVGQLPRVLRRDVDALWIHRGNQPFGGGNRSILIHTGTLAADYIANGWLEEILMHEAVHTSLDAQLLASPGWQAAQVADNRYISDYAQRSAGEDPAETFNAWFAQRHRADRIGPNLAATIANAVPARLAYLDALDLDLSPSTRNAIENDHYWLTGLGTFDGRHLRVQDVVLTVGTVFGPRFDPAEVERTRWGRVEIEFTACDRAELSWQAEDSAFGDGGFVLQRLAPSPALAACLAGGFDSGIDWATGGWYGGPGRSGEGLMIDVIDGGRAFVAWFTFGPPRSP